jgi:cation diffusion facilitator CzcD-associated flavoprotein CzcO
MSEKKEEYNTNNEIWAYIKDKIIPFHLVRFITFEQKDTIKFWLEPTDNHSNETVLSVGNLSTDEFDKVISCIKKYFNVQMVIK